MQRFNPLNNPLSRLHFESKLFAILEMLLNFLSTKKKHAAKLHIVVPGDTESTFCDNPLKLQVETHKVKLERTRKSRRKRKESSRGTYELEG